MLLTRSLSAGSREYVESLSPFYLRGSTTDFAIGVSLPEDLATDHPGPSRLIDYHLVHAGDLCHYCCWFYFGKGHFCSRYPFARCISSCFQR